ncbi:MAG TPA: DoxX family protein [Vicinamibacterales bacterium]|nr:DoxX family protein [Vicinamibacterales bacterium]
MNALLWILQLVLAAAFLAHGLMLLRPPADLIGLLNESMSTGFRIFLGIAEVLAAAGLTLPGVTRILPWLVPAAAVGIMIVMVGATILHVQRNEVSAAVTTAVLLILATFVAYMRWKVRPIAPRSAA